MKSASRRRDDPTRGVGVVEKRYADHPRSAGCWAYRYLAATGALGRPLALAVTAAFDTTSRDGALQLSGPYWLVVPAGTAQSDPAAIAQSLRDADAMDWRGPAVGPSDRSPLRKLYQPHPALFVARVALLDDALQRDQAAARSRERWAERFLRRAGIESSVIDRALAAFRSPAPL
jgi:hypothetical protein